MSKNKFWNNEEIKVDLEEIKNLTTEQVYVMKQNISTFIREELKDNIGHVNLFKTHINPAFLNLK